MTDDTFAAIRLELLTEHWLRRLKAGPVAVYLAYIRIASKSGKIANPTIIEVATLAGCSSRAVDRHRRHLVRLGLLAEVTVGHTPRASSAPSYALPVTFPRGTSTGKRGTPDEPR